MFTKIFQKFWMFSALVVLGFFLLEPAFTFSAQAYSKVELVPMALSTTVKDGTISLKWKALDKEKVDFDGYNIIYKKGVYKELSTKSVSVNYVTFNHFDFNNLTEGDWWSFQVLPVKLVNKTYVTVAAGSEVIKVKVKNKADKSKSRGADDLSVGEPKIYAVSSEELAVPIIKTPSKDQILTLFPRNAYLSWEKVLGSKRYEVELSCAGCNGGSEKWGKAVKYSTKKAHFLTSELSGDNHYRFRVRALVRTGIESGWSEYRYFSYDTSEF